MIRRPKIASALARDTCCETMIEARLAKPGSDSRSGTSPAMRAHLFQPRIDEAERVERRRNVVERGNAPHVRPLFSLRAAK